jgi:hypothetical protein
MKGRRLRLGRHNAPPRYAFTRKRGRAATIPVLRGNGYGPSALRAEAYPFPTPIDGVALSASS